MAQAWRKGKSKFGNKRVYDCDHCEMFYKEQKPTWCSCGNQDFTVFDSWKEYARWKELLLHQRAGIITNLKRQVRMPIIINGIKVFHYVADFDYYTDRDQHVIEDSKGFETDVFKIKRKCVEAFYGVSIKIT